MLPPNSKEAYQALYFRPHGGVARCNNLSFILKGYVGTPMTLESL